MTREEVEERLEEYAAYKAVKEAHEDTEEASLEISRIRKVIQKISSKVKRMKLMRLLPREIIPLRKKQNRRMKKPIPLHHPLMTVIFQNLIYRILIF